MEARRLSALKPVSSNDQHARSAQKASAAAGATRIPKPKPQAEPGTPGDQGPQPCTRCERADGVLRESQARNREQEDELKFVTEKAEELCVALTNAQEEAVQYQAEAERIQTEGQLTAQHTQLTAALADRDQRLGVLAAERGTLLEQVGKFEQAGGAASADGNPASDQEVRQAHLREAAEMANELLRDELRLMGDSCERLQTEVQRLANGSSNAANPSSLQAGDEPGRPRSGRQAQASDEPGSNEAAAVRIELAETQQRLAAAHKESALLQRELAGAMVSNERLQEVLYLLYSNYSSRRSYDLTRLIIILHYTLGLKDNLRLVAKSRKRDSLMPALPAPPPPAVSCADASTQAEAVAVLPGNNIGEGTALPKVESVAVAEGAATAEVPTGLDSEFDSFGDPIFKSAFVRLIPKALTNKTQKDAFASADLIAELETELEKLRVSAKSSSELAQAAESRALEADERAEKTREDSLLAQTDFKSAANEAQEAIATLEAQLLAVRSQSCSVLQSWRPSCSPSAASWLQLLCVTDAEVAAFAEYTQLAAREFKNSELATRLEAEAAEAGGSGEAQMVQGGTVQQHRAALDLAEASAVLSMADAEAAVVEAEEAREALMSAQAEANESKALLAEIGSSNALAEAAKCAAEEEVPNYKKKRR
ncbi:hypothetical protein T492DRAFT_840113 [Pavlovales sp. CCMP2436]|nr:hypothetical protein T492DRAFT_840113 [Pavlovales sp. CCMP2436]